MPDVLLQDYLEEISSLIDESRLGEAVRHCRFILQQYPQHLDTYRLLGKAFLEQGELQSAADVFRRVLSADPEDFIAHAGLAIIYKQEDRFKHAIWHMERAFEVDPYNVAIQEALKDLYGHRDGLPPGQLPLTHGALSRLYVNGDMYTQAIAELRELVREDESRIDLQVLLAEALWRDGQRVDAVEICHSVLDELPDCVKANAIVGEVWLMTGRHDEAQAYLQRVSDLLLPADDVLDDDSPAGRLFRTEGAPELPERVLVERLEERAALGMAPEDDEWVQDLEDDELLAQLEPEWLEVLQSEEPAAVEEDYDDDFDWLQEITGSDEGQEAVEDVTAGPAATSDEPADDSESTPPRWLESGDELSGLGEAPGDASWEQWLQQDPENDPDPSTGAEDSSESEEVIMGATEEYGNDRDEMPEDDMPDMDHESGAGDDAFDWLQELGDAGDDEDVERSLEADAGDLPDWLADDSDVMGDSDDSMQWLEEMPDADVAGEQEVDDLPRDELPDWLREEAAAAEEDADEDLSWLDQVAAGEGGAIEEPPTLSWPEDEDQQPEEPAQAEAQAEPVGDTPSAEITEAGAPAEEEAPAGDLASASVESDEDVPDDVPEDLEDAMAWLEQLAAQQGAPVEELPSLSEWGEADEDALLDEMPEDIDDAMGWLEDLADEEMAGEAALPSSDEAAAEEPFGDQAPADAAPFEAEDVEQAAASSLDAADDSGADWLEEFAETPAQDVEEAPEEIETAPEEPVAELAEEEQWDEPDWLDDLGDEVEVDEAWLDELAETEDGEPALEAAGVQGEAGDTADEAPEDLDEAMAWLEQLAQRQGAPVDELPSLDEFAAPEDDAQSIAELDDIPEDPEAALAWLEALAEGESAEEDDGVVEEPPTPAAPHDVVAARAEAEAILLRDEMEEAGEAPEELFEEMPEDPDEAMAWLERLAARQGAPLDELPSVETAEEDVATPDWIAREAADAEAQAEFKEETAPASEEELPAAEVEAPPVEAETPAPVEEMPAAEADPPHVAGEYEEPDLEEVEEAPDLPAAPEVDDQAEDVESEVERALMSELVDDDLEEPLPSWLELGDEAAEDLDWETEDAGIAGWLQAEEEATHHELEVPSLSQTGELEMPEAELPAEAPEQPEPPATEPASAAERPEVEVQEWAPPPEGMDGEALEAARRALSAGELDAALDAYRRLLEAQEGLGVVLSDLETATSLSDDRPQLWQLLGDAYMQNGQLQRALDAYRQALDML